MTGTLIGYARCSTDKQDLTAQRHALAELGVSADRIYTDHGLTGRNRDRPGLALQRADRCLHRPERVGRAGRQHGRRIELPCRPLLLNDLARPQSAPALG